MTEPLYTYVKGEGWVPSTEGGWVYVNNIRYRVRPPEPGELWRCCSLGHKVKWDDVFRSDSDLPRNPAGLALSNYAKQVHGVNFEFVVYEQVIE